MMMSPVSNCPFLTPSLCPSAINPQLYLESSLIFPPYCNTLKKVFLAILISARITFSSLTEVFLTVVIINPSHEGQGKTDRK